MNPHLINSILNERICLYEGVRVQDALPCVVLFRGKHVGVEPRLTGLREGYFWGCSGACGATAQSPYKELLSARVESGLSVPLSLLEEANSFAFSQHLPPLSGTDLTLASWSDPLAPSSTFNTSLSTTFPLALFLLFHTKFIPHNFVIRFLTPSHYSLSSPFPSVYIIDEQQELSDVLSFLARS